MYAISSNPVHCMRCYLEVPPENLKLTAETIQGLVYWNALYEAIYRLWLDSDEYEAWGRGELSNLESRVNRMGRDVVRDLSNARRTFYWCFQDQSVEAFNAFTHCINCARKISPYEDSTVNQLVCEDCSLVFVGPP